MSLHDGNSKRDATSESVDGNSHSVLRSRSARETDEFGESSADESTAIMRKSSSDHANYGAMTPNEDQILPVHTLASASNNSAERRRAIRRKSGSSRGNSPQGDRNEPQSGQRQEQPKPDDQQPVEHLQHSSWFKNLIANFGSVELENKGSVARDHLAIERTFLSWVRTSLSFASIGIAVTQLFRLNTSYSPSDDQTPLIEQSRLRSVGKPLGATFLGISILVLLLGANRYFESQHYVIRGKFPASRGTIIIISFVAFALIVSSLVVILVVAPRAFED